MNLTLTQLFMFGGGLLIGGLFGYGLATVIGRRNQGSNQPMPSDMVAELGQQFKAIAYDILDDQRKKNETEIGNILTPFRDHIQHVGSHIEQLSRHASQERAVLADQIKQISIDANNLTRALTSDSKTMGNWGELVLERILENSGLREGEGFLRQPTYRVLEAQVRPDVVLLLPENKHLIIDAKVSLSHYARFAGNDEGNKEEHLKNHLLSIKKHIRDLSEKNYHKNIAELNSLDFMVMFVPIEPAYNAAIGADGDLWEEAWRRNILLVGPTSLIFVLRTVATLWQQEAQNKNAREIARQAGTLYDKFVGFVEDLQNIGLSLNRARESYDQSLKKLSTGKGSLTSQTERLKKLGAAPSKLLPRQLLDDE
ncbi:MAG: DNA recombination protein RmuC [Alphaproteobacteria bacterium]|nr:DNA recombination protein RmuC [Alphaproteobacteria bacterium]